MEIDELAKKIKSELTGPLPGEEAQYKMASNVRFFKDLFKSTQKPKKGSVLILLFEKNNKINTVFIKRTDDGGVHSGQIAFPGGKFEQNDKILENTALRETKEEIGINPDKIKIVGELTKLTIPVSNFIVFPFVGFYSGEPEFNINQKEVQYLIVHPLTELLKPEIIMKKQIQIKSNFIEAPYFNVNENHIWGATAMILNEFLEIVKRIK